MSRLLPCVVACLVLYVTFCSAEEAESKQRAQGWVDKLKGGSVEDEVARQRRESTWLRQESRSWMRRRFLQKSNVKSKLRKARSILRRYKSNYSRMRRRLTRMITAVNKAAKERLRREEIAEIKRKHRYKLAKMRELALQKKLKQAHMAAAKKLAIAKALARAAKLAAARKIAYLKRRAKMRELKAKALRRRRYLARLRRKRLERKAKERGRKRKKAERRRKERNRKLRVVRAKRAAERRAKARRRAEKRSKERRKKAEKRAKRAREKKKKARWRARLKFTFNTWKFYKFKMRGTINSYRYYRFCRSKGLQVPCDHPHYADGRCVTVMKRARHFSYNPHHGLPRHHTSNTFWYCGRANHGRVLWNYHNSHRWASPHGGHVFCVQPPYANPRKKVATWNGWDFYKVRVPGTCNSRNIRRACGKYHYQIPCDHVSYYDGKCISISKWNNRHMSYSRHHSMDRGVVDRTVWYCGRANHGWALQNWRNTHRWTNRGDKYELTMCIKRTKAAFNSKKVAFTYNQFRFYKVRVPGRMNSKAILKVCRKKGMITVCDHPAYKDGKCETVMKRALHFSYNRHHNINREVIDKSFWYCGRANGGRALQNAMNSHRWSHGQRDGDAFCAKRPKVNPKKKVATWNHWDFYKVHVQGVVRSASIMKACKKYGYLTPCDHTSYYDGKCVVVAKHYGRHMSYSRHHDFPRDIIDRTVWYCGRANRGRALMNWRNTHRWTDIGDRYETTMCVKRPKASYNSRKVAFVYNKWRFYKIRVPGKIDSKAIYKKCKGMGLITICDHPAYRDGRCQAVMKRNLHFSYNRHHGTDRDITDNTFWYCGRANGGRALQNIHNTHRWSHGQREVDAFCGRRPSTNPKARVTTWNGWMFYKVNVKGKATSRNIRRACQRYHYQTPCDHTSYYDGRCVVINKRNGRHMSYPPHNDFPRDIGDRMVWYCGRANHGRALQTYRNTHRWTNKGDLYEQTLCVKRQNKKINSKKVAFVFNKWRFYKFRMRGKVSSRNIYKTCRAAGLKTVCDHPHYADGKCCTVMKRARHFSYNGHHGIDRDVIDNSWWYCGRSNHGRALQNKLNSHRWSTGQIDGEMFCAKPPKYDSRRQIAKYNGWRFFAVSVQGTMNSYNIRQACQSVNMKPLCGHPHYYDGRCVRINGVAHWSYNPHVPGHLRGIFDRICFYCGSANHGWSLMNWRNTHRWTNRGDRYEGTLCVKR